MGEIDFIQEIIDGIQESLDNPATLALPSPSIVSFYQNLKNRKLWLDSDIGPVVIEYARYIMQWNEEDAGKPIEERKPIQVYLFSNGGFADHMWMFLDVIAASETPVWTINMGKCWSASALIFMAGHKRIMMPSATVLIHEGSSEISGDAVKVIDQAESYRAMVKKMHAYILDHSKIPSATLTRKKNNDWELTSEDCMKYGVCDAVATKMSDVL